MNFINHELRRVDGAPHEIRDCCGVIDTLALARRMHPGQRNSLDALAKRYSVDNSKRELHGALLDAQILTDIYLSMTGGQVSLSLEGQEQVAAAAGPRVEQRVDRAGLELVVQFAAPDEVAAHEALLTKIAKRCGRAVAVAQPEHGGFGSDRGPRRRDPSSPPRHLRGGPQRVICLSARPILAM